jgi:hypothetical protein
MRQGRTDLGISFEAISIGARRQRARIANAWMTAADSEIPRLELQAQKDFEGNSAFEHARRDEARRSLDGGADSGFVGAYR